MGQSWIDCSFDFGNAVSCNTLIGGDVAAWPSIITS